MRKKPQLSIIAHATKGSDSIDEGIHLRWAFYHKLGFPTDGFRLYRRTSKQENRICLDSENFRKSNLKIPYNHRPHHPRRPLLIIKSKESHLRFEEKTIHRGKRARILNMGASSTIEFRPKTPHIEIEFVVMPNTKFRISTLSGETVLHSQVVKARSPGERKIEFNTHATDRLIFEGSGILLKRICFWICTDDDSWGEPINDKCGFGLPVLSAVDSDYLRKVFARECDPDWAVAACRLGPESICNLKGQNFDDLKEVLGRMRGDGVKVPVGWNIMEMEAESPCQAEEGGPSMSISPYDLLIMQSENPDIAKVLGLYWIDRSARDNVYYDYKVIADWPSEPRTLWRLDGETTFEDLEVGRTMFTLFNKNDLIFAGLNGTIVEAESRLARVSRGLAFNYPNPTFVGIFFWKPTREVQLFIRHEGSSAGLVAFSASGRQVDQQAIRSAEGVLSVHAHDLAYVIVYGTGLVIHRIHHDEEFLNYGIRKAIICGVKKGPQRAVDIPTGLKATCLRGSVTEIDEDCREVQRRFRAGLRWDLPGDEDTGIFSGAPVGYLVERTNPRGETVLVTDRNPVHVVPVGPEVEDEFTRIEEEGQPVLQKDCAGNEIKERQYFHDSVSEKGRYRYRVAAMDLFGRQSSFSRPSAVVLTPPKPPHPVDVMAKFIDINAYDQDEDTFADPNLSGTEKDWLRANGISAIVVSWKWPENLREQAPNARSFRVRLKEGWLNLIRGTVTDVDSVPGGFTLHTDIQSDIPQNVGAGSLVDEWLRQGKLIYKIKENSGGGNTIITVFPAPDYLNLPPQEARPKVDAPLVLPVTTLQSQGGAAIDYTDPAPWDAPIHEETISFPSREEYKVYIPYPEFETSEADPQTEKTRYGQVAVSTVSDEGEGSVSPPASIMSVYRELPDKVTFEDTSGLKATAADFYGKSTFPLRWPKPSEESRFKYYVYRSMDESIYMVDWSLRPRRPNLDTTMIEYFPTDWSPIKQQQVADSLNKLNNFSEGDTGKAEAMEYYASLSSDELRVLANLEGNESAFSKLNEVPIDPFAPDYQNRRIPGEPDYTPDETKVLYADSTLDGRGSNRYFYRIRVVDEIGNVSPFGISTLPVEAPKVTPPVPPNIGVENGDRLIIIKWSKRSSSAIARYLVYRTEEQRKSKDWRRMVLIAADTPANLAPDPGAPHKFEYIDATVEPEKEYFYGIRAEDDQGNTSKVSKARIGKAYDYGTPAEPTWIRREWVKLAQDGTEHPWGDADLSLTPAVALEFTVERPYHAAKIKRAEGGGGYAGISEWLKGPAYVPAGGGWKFTYYDTKADSSKDNTYRLRLKSTAGIYWESVQEKTVQAP